MKLEVAAVQLSSGSDVSSNVDEAESLVNEAADQGAQYVQLPEYFNYLGPFSGFEGAAETVPGPTTSRMAKLAKSRALILHLGSLLERSGEPGKFFNTSVVIGASGEIVATYRKIHLFDVNVPDAIVHRESDIIEPGEEIVVASLEEFALGMSICFDVRFPELYRKLALAGANVIAVPAAFNAITGRAHWDLLVRARAIENHSFVVAAAQVGTTAEGISTYGHSLIVDPWGEVLAESTTDKPEVVTATLDLSEVTRRRAQIPVMDFRRPDVYGRSVRVT
ncbi:MAG TPA: carbon-nitrogen hydrolase family protein [Acidimicrobiales bacterium]|nr:carbon-nitrogen hydrolase family protein [Acidimicrobiales bacterium]